MSLSADVPSPFLHPLFSIPFPSSPKQPAMRLLQIQEDGGFNVTGDLVNDIPPYAILSHTWHVNQDQEVTFHDIQHNIGQQKQGYQKLRYGAQKAAADNLQYLWVDTCCIDRSNNAETAETIKSMFELYQNAAQCYVYPPPVSNNGYDGRLKKLFVQSRRAPDILLSNRTPADYAPKTTQQWKLVMPASRNRPRERSFLPVLIKGRRFDGFPDTNSTRNVMTEAFALSVGAEIDRTTAGRAIFTNAIGEKMSSVGRTSLTVAFPDNPGKSWSCQFQVVQDCPEALVFGDNFLRVLTETLTKFRHRLKKAAVSGIKRMWRLLQMDMPQQKLECHIDSQLAFANMDTGSDVDLVSLEYAESRGWDISYLPSDEGYVMLSNGTMKKVTGYVDTWLNLGEDVSKRRFYVLEGLVSDVVLGDGTLEDLDVFNKYVDLFVDSDDQVKVDAFHMIEWIERYDNVERDVETLLRPTQEMPAKGKLSLRQRLTHALRHGVHNAPADRPVSRGQFSYHFYCIRQSLMISRYQSPIKATARRPGQHRVSSS